MHSILNTNSTVSKVFSILFVILCLSAYQVAGQVVADFSADDTVGCDQLVVHFTNEGSSGASYSFNWYFGALGTSTNENPVFNFYTTGIFPVKLVVTNTNTLEKDSVTKNIYVFLTPSANLLIDSTNACVHGKVEFQSGFSEKDSGLWIFGDGTSLVSRANYMYHVYSAYGAYPLSYITYLQKYDQQCSDTSNYSINVDGPIADITVDPEEACKGTPVTFTMTPVFDVSTFEWNLNEGDIQSANPVVHTYDTKGYISVWLTINGATGSCTIEDTVHIFEVTASFTYSDIRCDQQRVFFINTSVGNDTSYWDFGNGTTSQSEDGSAVYSAGTYPVSLRIINSHSCADSNTENVLINPLPVIDLIDDQVICPGEPVDLSASGGHIIEWFPPEAFDDPYSYTPQVSPDSNTLYQATITDTITHCSNTGSVTVYVQPGFIPDKISVYPTNDSLIIGESLLVTIFDTLGRDLSYTWTPETGISCLDCNQPVIQPFESTTYELVISDTNHCFSSESFEIVLVVKKEYRIGVPEAFTPNNDEINPVIKVDGWGIEKLLEFRIFNRWGTQVFYTDDINEGWDGYYKGKLQNIDTYSYIIKAKMWDSDEIITKKGTFSLLR
jgi:gliding motility-associated-like protein